VLVAIQEVVLSTKGRAGSAGEGCAPQVTDNHTSDGGLTSFLSTSPVQASECCSPRTAESVWKMGLALHMSRLHSSFLL
jgi:hypothetical protein